MEVLEVVRTINRQEGKETRENRNNAGNIREGKNSIGDSEFIHESESVSCPVMYNYL